MWLECGEKKRTGRTTRGLLNSICGVLFDRFWLTFFYGKALNSVCSNITDMRDGGFKGMRLGRSPSSISWCKIQPECLAGKRRSRFWQVGGSFCSVQKFTRLKANNQEIWKWEHLLIDCGYSHCGYTNWLPWIDSRRCCEGMPWTPWTNVRPVGMQLV